MRLRYDTLSSRSLAGHMNSASHRACNQCGWPIFETVPGDWEGLLPAIGHLRLSLCVGILQVPET